MFDKYLSVGGSEIVNAERVQSYVENLFPSFPLKRFGDSITIHDALGEDEYTTPYDDAAEWVDPAEPATLDFYGVYPLSFSESMGGATMSATVTESIGDGGSVGQERDSTRQIRISALLVGKNELAVEAGLTWLTSAVRAEVCGSTGGTCGASDMDFFLDRPLLEPVSYSYNLVPDPKPIAAPFALGDYQRRITRQATPSGVGWRYVWTNNQGTAPWALRGPVFTAAPGKQYTGSIYGRQSATLQGILPFIEFLNSANVSLGIFYGTTINPSAINYTRGIATGVAPAGTAKARIGWGNGPSNPNGSVGPSTGIRTNNYVLNPRSIGTSGWTVATTAATLDTAGESDSGATPQSYKVGGGGGRWTTLTTGSATAANNAATLTIPGLVVGQVYTVRVTVPLATIPNIGSMKMLEANATLVARGNQSGVWAATTYGVSFTALATTQKLVITPVATSGVTLYFGDFMVQDGNVPTGAFPDRTYFDGATPDGSSSSRDDEFGNGFPGDGFEHYYAWTGAADASASFQLAGPDWNDLSSVQFVEGAVPLDWYDGDLPDDPPYQYDWTGKANASPTVRIANSVPYQLEPYLRTFHGVSATSAPAIIKRMKFGPDGCNGSAIQVEMIFTATNPYRFGPDLPVPIPRTPDTQTSMTDPPTGVLRNMTPQTDDRASNANWNWKRAYTDAGTPATSGNFTADPIQVPMPSPRLPVAINNTPKATAVTLKPQTIAADTIMATKGFWRVITEEDATYSASVYVMPQVTMTLYIGIMFAYGGGGSDNGGTYGNGVVCPAGVWTRLSVVAPSPGTYSATRIALVNGAGITIPSTKRVYVSSVMAVDNAFAGTLKFFNGSTPTDALYDYTYVGTSLTELTPGSVGNEGGSIATPLDDAAPTTLIDPILGRLPQSPTAPAVLDPSSADVALWDRTYYPIDPSDVATWGQVVPTIILQNRGPSGLVRGLRIRFFANPLERDPKKVDPTSYCGEFIVSYMPPNTELVINGGTEEISASVGGSTPIEAGQLIYGTGGVPPTWPVLTCGVPYFMTIDKPTKIIRSTSEQFPDSVLLTLARKE